MPKGQIPVPQGYLTQHEAHDYFNSLNPPQISVSAYVTWKKNFLSSGLLEMHDSRRKEGRGVFVSKRSIEDLVQRLQDAYRPFVAKEVGDD
jgi:hypothetical protein